MIFTTKPSIDILNDIFSQEAECEINYGVCSSSVTWATSGSCPQCKCQAKNKMLCSSCHSEIVSGAKMQHLECGFRGLGLDFFKSFRPV